MHQINMILTPKIEKSPYRGRGTPLPHNPPRSVASLPRICSQNIVFVFLEVRNHSPPPPPHFWRPVYTPLLVTSKPDLLLTIGNIILLV